VTQVSEEFPSVICLKRRILIEKGTMLEISVSGMSTSPDTHLSIFLEAYNVHSIFFEK
jgi:hypothetical protein